MSVMTLGRITAATLCALSFAMLAAPAVAGDEPGGPVDPTTVPGIEQIRIAGGKCSPDYPEVTPYSLAYAKHIDMGPAGMHVVRPAGVLSSDCTIYFKVKSPDGRAYAITGFQLSGYNGVINPKTIATLDVSYGAQGRKPSLKVKKTLKTVPSGKDEDFIYDFQVGPTRCSVDDTHEIKLAAKLSPGTEFGDWFGVNVIDIDLNTVTFNPCTP